MKHGSVGILFAILFFNTLLFSDSSHSNELAVTSVSLAQPWQPGATQSVVLNVVLPKKFHAYVDQFKILNIKPEEFKIGEIKTTPEVKFYDKYSKKNRSGIFEKGSLTLLIEAPEKIANTTQKISFDLRHQICSDAVCYLPKNISIEINVAQMNSPNEILTAPFKESFSLLKSLEQTLQTSLLLSFLSVFIAGILTSFTPCIFPMLPITISILGHQADRKNRLHNFSRALSYVLGIAITYSTLGLLPP